MSLALASEAAARLGPPAALAGERQERLSVERITDREGFAGLRQAWDELLGESPADGLFLTWEWLFTWWEHLGQGRRLALLAVRRGRRLVALAPLMLAASRRERLLPPTFQLLGTGRVGSDYLDLIVRPGEEGRAVEALADHLAGERRVVELAQLPRPRSAAAQLATRLARRGWRSLARLAGVCPYIDLEGLSWEGYLSSLGASHRSNVRRQMRKLRQHFEVRFERVDSGARLEEELDVLLSLHQRRWQARGGSDAFAEPAVVAFHREVARRTLARGWLRLYVLRLDGRPAASLYGFLYRGRFLFYQSGFDPAFAEHSVGTVVVGLTIRAAIEEGAREYDMLHGEEPYKFHWARRTRELARLELFPPSLAGLLRRQARRASFAAKRQLRLWLGRRPALPPPARRTEHR